MEEEVVKEAFRRVKNDFQSLFSELNSLKSELLDLRVDIQNLKYPSISQTHVPQPISQSMQPVSQQQFSLPSVSQVPTHSQENPTIPTHNPTQNPIPTDEWPYYALKSTFTHVSTGNDGVPTDRQTNQQTDNQHIFRTNSNTKPTDNSHLDRAKEILDSLDSLKKEVRIKFKRLTEQEIKVFSLLYQLEDSGELVDYPALASKAGLTESSIRDYIRKISLKGIPIAKEKLNNKRIILHVSQELKKIATLDTILKLRGL